MDKPHNHAPEAAPSLALEKQNKPEVEQLAEVKAAADHEVLVESTKVRGQFGKDKTKQESSVVLDKEVSTAPVQEKVEQQPAQAQAQAQESAPVPAADSAKVNQAPAHDQTQEQAQQLAPVEQAAAGDVNQAQAAQDQASQVQTQAQAQTQSEQQVSAQAQQTQQAPQQPNADDFLAHIGKKINVESLKQGGKWAIFNFWTYYVIVNLFVASFFLFKFQHVGMFCIVLVLGFAGSLFSLLRSKSLVAKEVGAVKIGPNDPQFSELYQIVEYLAYKAKLPKTPEVAIYESDDINAFAVGASQSNAMIAFSTGLLSRMPMEEVAAVAAHEVGHIVSRDMMGTALIKGSVRFTALVITFPLWALKLLIMIYFREPSWIKICDICIKVVTACVNAVGWLIERAFSRHREYRADATAAVLTSPVHMQSALARLSSDIATPLPNQPSLDCYRISGRINFFEFFSTHPTLEHRIESLYNKFNMQNMVANGQAPAGQNQTQDPMAQQGQVAPQATNVDVNMNPPPSIVDESKQFHEAKLAAIAAGAVGFGLGMAMAEEAVQEDQAAQQQEQAAQAQQQQAQSQQPHDQETQEQSQGNQGQFNQDLLNINQQNHPAEQAQSQGDTTIEVEPEIVVNEEPEAEPEPEEKEESSGFFSSMFGGSEEEEEGGGFF